MGRRMEISGADSFLRGLQPFYSLEFDGVGSQRKKKKKNPDGCMTPSSVAARHKGGKSPSGRWAGLLSRVGSACLPLRENKEMRLALGAEMPVSAATGPLLVGLRGTEA